MGSEKSGRAGGNPDLAIPGKIIRKGPKTPGTKLRSSMNSSKGLHLHSIEVEEALKELGVKFEKAGEALTIKKAFKDWFLSKTGAELTEIDKLGEIINILETETAVRTMEKLEKGIPLDKDDLKLIRLLKDTLETSHRLQFGDKHLHAHIGYKSIRDVMFDKNADSRDK